MYRLRTYLIAGVAAIAVVGALAINRFSEPSQLETRINSEESIPNDSQDKYGVLICASSDIPHKENIGLAYQTLLKNGFNPNNIYVVGGSEDTEKPKHMSVATYDMIRSYQIDTQGSPKDISMIFDHLSGKVDANDLLFVYITGYGATTETSDGTRTKRMPYILAGGEEIPDTEMLAHFEKIRPDIGAVVSDVCFGGKLVQNLPEGYVGISAAQPGRLSWSDTFPKAFFDAWQDSTSDANGDGNVSLQEAFEHAVENDVNTINGSQKPQSLSPKKAQQVFLNQ